MYKCTYVLVMLLLLTIEQLYSQHITSSIVSTHMLGDLSAIQMTKLTHWVLHSSDIKHDLEITVDEAYHGIVKEVAYQRLIPDTTCEVVDCNYCQNRGVIFTKTVDKEKKLEQVLQTPCPVCIGKIKTGKNGCNYYKEQVDKVMLQIPPGCRLGYVQKYPGLGNAMLDYSIPGNFSFSMGDLELRVGSITDPLDRGLNMTEDGLELEIIMEPMEALEGFNRQIDFFDDRIIKVNKTNKTTLPDTELILEDDKLKGNGRDGLLIRFTLPTIDDLKNKLIEDLKAMESNTSTTVIESQKDFEDWGRGQKDVKKQFKKDAIIIKFLHDIKRRQDRDGLKGNEGKDDDNIEEYSTV